MRRAWPSRAETSRVFTTPAPRIRVAAGVFYLTNTRTCLSRSGSQEGAPRGIPGYATTNEP